MFARDDMHLKLLYLSICLLRNSIYSLARTRYVCLRKLDMLPCLRQRGVRQRGGGNEGCGNEGWATRDKTKKEQNFRKNSVPFVLFGYFIKVRHHFFDVLKLVAKDFQGGLALPGDFKVVKTLVVKRFHFTDNSGKIHVTLAVWH